MGRRMTVLLVEGYQEWVCPRDCQVSERVSPPLPASAQRWHACAKLHGLKAPLVLAGTDCTVRAVERGDYLNGDEQRRGDDGRPYMAVVTEYADGRNDAAVFAAVATARIGG
jgi:hypothetical protein